MTSGFRMDVFIIYAYVDSTVFAAGGSAHLGVPVVMVTQSDPSQPFNKSLWLPFDRWISSVEESTHFC